MTSKPPDGGSEEHLLPVPPLREGEHSDPDPLSHDDSTEMSGWTADHHVARLCSPDPPMFAQANGQTTSQAVLSQPRQQTIKPKSKRNLVILMDGTSNEYCLYNTNIIKLASVLQTDENQLMFYDSGVGTTLPAAASTWFDIRRKVGIALDEAFAWNFAEHVQSAYRYLMDMYQDGDRIFIFGFSRGSYSARSLAGMIEKVGLLPAGSYSQIPIAYKIYENPHTQRLPCLDASSTFTANPRNIRNDPKGLGSGFTESIAHGYKRTFGVSRDVKVHFLGVYDTVASLGLLEVKELPFASNVDSVRFFRQALALNERRAKFQPVYRHPEVPSADPNQPFCTEHTKHKLARFVLTTVTSVLNSLRGLFGRMSLPPDPPVNQVGDLAKVGDGCGHTNEKQYKTKEVWFLGCHSDVGGGNDRNGLASLSNISLRWMLREAEHCGLILDAPDVLLQSALDLPPVVDFIQKHEGLEELLGKLRKQAFNQVDIPEEQNQGIVLTSDELRDRIKDIISPGEVHQLVDIAAAFDTLDPRTVNLPKEADIKKLPKESLTWPWWVVEFMILQTRSYAGGAGTKGKRGDFSWRMLPGELQKIHRSVQRKLQYDKYFKGYVDPWTPPKNCLPPGTNWKNLRQGGVPPGGWED